jgi:methionyl-tRNA synthetase
MRVFISTSIPYVNSVPHIGHALEFVQADVAARAFRLQKDTEVFFLSGTDENALKNLQAAEEAGISPKEWVAKHAEVFKNLLKELNISNDDFIRTSSEERHLRGAQKLWEACKKDIYKKKYTGLYCLGCEEFKTGKELANGECPEHPGKKLEEVEEENYFFRLSAYEEKIKSAIESGKVSILPDSRRNEIREFLKSGLGDFSISRSQKRARGWGVPVPNDPEQVMYVWFDALSNYINALGYAENSEQFKKFWTEAQEIIHFVGKGINRFHSVYWLGILLSAGLKLPTTIFVHGYITANGQKISKSLGNTVDPFSLIKKYGTDAVRYYLLREIPTFGDGDFSEEKFIGRYNADLANGLGNFAARTLTLAEKIGAVDLRKYSVEEDLQSQILKFKIRESQGIQTSEFHKILEDIWTLISLGDKYANDQKPWETKDPRVILGLLTILSAAARWLKPFLPATSEKIEASILWPKDVVLVKKLPPLFPRI